MSAWDDLTVEIVNCSAGHPVDSQTDTGTVRHTDRRYEIENNNENNNEKCVLGYFVEVEVIHFNQFFQRSCY